MQKAEVLAFYIFTNVACLHDLIKCKHTCIYSTWYGIDRSGGMFLISHRGTETFIMKEEK